MSQHALSRQSKITSKTGSVARESIPDGSDVKEVTAHFPERIKSSKLDAGRRMEMSSFHREIALWRQFILKHRRDLRKAKPVVDDKPPTLNIPQLYDREFLNVQLRNVTSFYATNPETIKILHAINVFGGKTETLKFNYDDQILASNFNCRREAAKSIETGNRHLLEMIDNAIPRLPRVKEYARMWKKMEGFIESGSQFPLFWKVNEKKKKRRKNRETIEVGPSRVFVKQFVTEKSVKYPDKRPRVFLEISIKNVGSVGKLVAVLFSDYVPMTVENFLAFCNPKSELTYKGCLFYLIFQNFFCQTGDVIENKGFGGTSIYGPYFGDEDHTLQHGQRGVLTMFNKIPNRNQCQFLITFRSLKSLDGSNVVFGKIVKGFHVLDVIESVGSKMTGKPKVDIFISDCDEI